MHYIEILHIVHMHLTAGMEKLHRSMVFANGIDYSAIREEAQDEVACVSIDKRSLRGNDVYMVTATQEQ